MCSRNAFGDVPFQHALRNRNYAAALKLLVFVTEVLPGESCDLSHNKSPLHSSDIISLMYTVHTVHQFKKATLGAYRSKNDVCTIINNTLVELYHTAVMSMCI